jgi:hypothetical protein
MPTTFRRHAALAALAAAGAALAAPAFAQDVLVVAPADLQPAVTAWKAHREGQGLRVDVREPGADVAATVRTAHGASGGKLRFVLLLGDVDRVPCAYVPVVATAKWEKDTRIATDAPYADVDGDGVPDLAVGRLPADAPAEALAMLARPVALETGREADDAEWRRRVNIVAGTGGFGPLQDAALEQMTKQFLTKDVPPEYVVTGTYGNPLSAWCPPPGEFANTAVERFNEGEFAWVYIGHGSPNELDRVRVGRERFPIFGAAEVAKVDVRRGAPLAVFVACSTGMFDAERDCLAEEILRRPRGPAAVIASSRVSTPYSNGILAKEMLSALFADRVATAGELLVAMKRRLLEPRPGDAERKQIETLAATFFEPDASRRAADRREHVALYNLLGDPCLRLARPADLPISAPGTVVPGSSLVVTGTAPAPGRLVVEVARRRDTAVPIGPRKTDDEWRDTYRRANALEVARTEARTAAGAFRVEVPVPAEARPGPGYVRAWFAPDVPVGAAQGAPGAAGGRYLEIVAPPRPSNPVEPPADGGR